VLKLGYWWMSGTWPAPAPPSGRPRKEALFRRLEEAVLHSPGTLDPAIRAAIAEERDPPEPLRAYVEKVRRHAYKVTDEDVAALHASGFGEDQIYEATLAAAFGAARKRLERGLSALDSRARVDPAAISA
jgi:hypothetical protein